MKRRVITLLLALTLLLTGCSGSGNIGMDPVEKVKYPTALAEDDYQRRHERREENALSAEEYGVLRDFSARSSALALQGGENAVFSPLSLWYALSLCAEGAEGETAAALMRVLGAADDVDDIAHDAYMLLYEDNELTTLRLSNSAWINKEYALEEDFTETAAEEYFAQIYSCDYGDAATGEAMGKWVKEATGGLLGGGAFETNPTSIMTLFSALYFSGQWSRQFEEENNVREPFTNADGSDVTVEYMYIGFEGDAWREGSSWTSATLNFRNTGSMTFVLPHEGESVETVLPRLDEILSGGGTEHRGTIHWQVPKFEVTSKFDKETMERVITDLGAGIIFDMETADFSDICSMEGVKPYVDSVEQEATIAIDENGAVAAAYTKVEVGEGGDAPPREEEELDFILNRPFLFIVESQGVPLFVGTVQNMG